MERVERSDAASIHAAERRPSGVGILTMREALLDELELLRRARAGDGRAFDALVRAHFARVHGALHRLVGNHEDAEDLAQECFVRAFSNLRYFRGEGTFLGWCLRIAVHLAHDHFRARGGRPVCRALADLPLEPESPREGPPLELSRRELQRALAAELERLPEPLRTAFVLRVLEGHDYTDVAQATRLRVATVRTQVMKARRRLVARLAPWLVPGLPGKERGL